MPEWLQNVLIGLGLIVATLVIERMWKRWRGEKDAPSAEEIAAARIELEGRRRKEMHDVACELFSLAADMRVQASIFEGHFRKREVLERGFEATATEFANRWEPIKPKLHVLERDDIPRLAENLVTDFARECAEVAQELKPFQDWAEMKAPLGRHKLEALPRMGQNFTGLKYDADTVKDRVAPYRKRFQINSS